MGGYLFDQYKLSKIIINLFEGTHNLRLLFFPLLNNKGKANICTDNGFLNFPLKKVFVVFSWEVIGTWLRSKI